jgi:hypothetical protein
VNFLHPAFLAGLAAVAIPVAIHLLNRIRIQETAWAAMRFLQDSLRKNERKLKVEDLILLILRCLFVALLVIAFARPFLETPGGGFTASGGASISIFLLDNSASMAQSDGVKSRFEEGKTAIRDLLEKAPSGSRFGFFLVSNRVEAIQAKPSPDANLMRRSLDLATLSDRSTNLSQGIRAACDSLKAFPQEKAEIHIVTDSQAPAWMQLDEIKKLQSAHPQVTLRPVIIGQRGEENTAIVSLRPEGGVPAVGQPSRYHVEVANFGSKPVDGIRVTLSVDDGAPSDEVVLPQIPAGSRRVANLFARFPSAGYHTVTAAIPPDRLPIDNQRSSALRVFDKMRVMVVAPNNPSGRSFDSDAYFLANALVPVSAERMADYYLKLSVSSLAEAERARLETLDALYLCNPEEITPGIAAALKKYVTNGGNLVIFPGSKTDPAKWMANKDFAELLPATVGPVKTPERPVRWQGKGLEHPIATLWNDKNQGNLDTIEAAKYLTLMAKPAGAAATPLAIARYANGDAAALEWNVGRGHVALFASSATPEWNNLPLHPAFVSLMHRTLGYLHREQTPRLVLSPGEAFHLRVPMELLGKEFFAVRPGKDSEKRPAGRVELQDEFAVIDYRETAQSGVYQIFVDGDPLRTAVLAVQMAPEESDLRQAPRNELEALTKPAEKGSTGGFIASSVTREFWTPLIWLAALVAIAEMGLAHWFSRSR